MKIYKNKNYTKRDYETTNVVACIANNAPNDNWVYSPDFNIEKLNKLYTENGVTFYGFL